MPTRATIIIANEEKQFYFYRHNDGNPTEEIPSLLKFIEWVNDETVGEARWSDPTQVAGWLVVWGRKEFLEAKQFFQRQSKHNVMRGDYWKVGCYQPNNRITPDSLWIYMIQEGELFYTKNLGIDIKKVAWIPAIDFKGEE